MNLPADPRERERITASMLQHRFRNLQSTISGQDDDASCQLNRNNVNQREQSYVRQQKREKHSRNFNNNNDFELISDKNVFTTAHKHRVWKQNTNQHTRQKSDSAKTTAEGHLMNSVIEQTKSSSSNNNNRRLLLPRNHRVHANKEAPLCESEEYGDLLNDAKSCLKLPSDTQLSADFIRDFNKRLVVSHDGQLADPLSRVERRRSLLDIGFGRLSTYSKLHVLGAGTYSIVYKGTSRLTQKLVALKEIHLEREEGIPFTAIREVSLLKRLRHSNIITLHDLICTGQTLILVFEFVDRDLSRYMDDCDHKINLDNIKLFLFQLLRGLKYCHERKILHRDIKPQNILISALGELKLADFGLARAKTFPTKTYTDEVVTLWYRPPDILLGNVEYGADIDMWGVGCIFFEMVAGFTLFLGIDPNEQIGCIFEILGTPNELEWPNIKFDLEQSALEISHHKGRDLASIATRLDGNGIDLLKGFLKCNPQLRMASREALYHEYFSTLPSEIYTLDDSKSLFSIAELRLSHEEHACNQPTLHNVHV